MVEIERVWDTHPEGIKRVMLEAMVAHYEAELVDILKTNRSTLPPVETLFQQIDPNIDVGRIHACMNEYDAYRFSPVALSTLLRQVIHKGAVSWGWMEGESTRS